MRERKERERYTKDGQRTMTRRTLTDCLLQRDACAIKATGDHQHPVRVVSVFRENSFISVSLSVERPTFDVKFTYSFAALGFCSPGTFLT